jgi:hypothetical protein
MQRDVATIAALKQTLTGIAQSLGGLPSAKLDNLDEWKSRAPAIVQTAQRFALTLRELEPAVAQLLDEVADECEAMIAALERDRDEPPKGTRIATRDTRISELQRHVAHAAETLA